MPTLRQVLTLEAVLERAVITGAAMRAIEGEAGEIDDAFVEAVADVANVLKLVKTMDSDGRRSTAEIGQVRRATQNLLKDAEKLADAAAALQQGRRA